MHRPLALLALLAIAGQQAMGSAEDRDDWQPFEAGRQRRQTARNPLDAVSWLNLRRFVCGGSAATEECLNDERFNQLQPDFLRKIAAHINGLAATSSTAAAADADVQPVEMLYDSAGDSTDSSLEMLPASTAMDEYSNDVNIWNSLNLSGRREGPFYVDEPDYVLTKAVNTLPKLLFDYMNDPFIPQRGRRRLERSDEAQRPKRVSAVARAAAPMQRQRQQFNRQSIAGAQMTSHRRRQLQQQQQRRRRRHHGSAPSSGNGAAAAAVIDRVADWRPATATAATAAAATTARLSQQLFPLNLSPATGGPTTMTAGSAATRQTGGSGANRDTFYLARGSRAAEQLQAPLQQPPLQQQQPQQQQ